MHKTESTANIVNQRDEAEEAFAVIEQAVYAALETYSNVHRGSGHKSMVSTHLYERARNIVHEYLGLKKGKYVVIFCSPRRAEIISSHLRPGSYHRVSSRDIGLPLGLTALAVKRNGLPAGMPIHAGGGTTKLVSPGWVVWADSPDKFEAGTPAIINVITFARALRLSGQSGKKVFQEMYAEELSAAEILYDDELKEYSGKKLLEELRKTVIGKDFPVPTTEGIKHYINLDNAASTPTFTPVWNSFSRTLRQTGRVQRDIIREVRSICAKALGAPLADYDMIFTSNTTEAICLAAENFSREFEPDAEPVVLSTIMEHNSNDLPWRKDTRNSLIRLRTDPEGFVDLNELDALLHEYNQKGKHGKKRIRIVAVTGASNVLGVFNDPEEIGRITHKHGALLLVDAAQIVAHRQIETKKWGIDYLAFSAHKVYAPFGTGMLLARKGLLNFSSEEMEIINSAGEENAAGIAALGKAILLLQRIGLDLIRAEEKALTEKLLHGLAQIEGLSVYGIQNPDSARFSCKGGVIVFSLKNIFSNVVAKELADRGGIGIRYGCHCAHILIKHLVGVGPFLERFQGIMALLFPVIRFPGLARVSLGIENSEKDIDILIQTLGKIARKDKVPKANILQQMNDFTMAAVRKVYLD